MPLCMTTESHGAPGRVHFPTAAERNSQGQHAQTEEQLKPVVAELTGMKFAMLSSPTTSPYTNSCRRLRTRVEGFDSWGPLDTL